MENGDDVPDSILVPIVLAHLQRPEVKESGWLLDGWPRTAAQAAALRTANFTPHVFLVLDVPDEQILERCVERRYDPVEGKIYHLKYDPPPEGEVAERVVQRRIDTKEHVEAQLAAYHDVVVSVGGVFRDRLRLLDGAQPETAIFSEIAARVQGRPVGPKIILCGAPGSGKGKQGEHLIEHTGVRHVSAGDLVRRAASVGTPLGLQAKEALDAGESVPEKLVAEIVAAELTGKKGAAGWILEGYPRTEAQARRRPSPGSPHHFALCAPSVPTEPAIHARSRRCFPQASTLKAAGVSPHCILDIEVPDAVLVERITHRRLDPETGTIYHLQVPPCPRRSQSHSHTH
jgi:adenylate kinase